MQSDQGFARRRDACAALHGLGCLLAGRSGLAGAPLTEAPRRRRGLSRARAAAADIRRQRRPEPTSCPGFRDNRARGHGNGGAPVTLRLVPPAPRTRTRRKPVAALAEHATPVEARIAKRPVRGMLAKLSGAAAQVAPLRLVSPRTEAVPYAAEAPVAASVEPLEAQTVVPLAVEPPPLAPIGELDFVVSDLELPSGPAIWESVDAPQPAVLTVVEDEIEQLLAALEGADAQSVSPAPPIEEPAPVHEVEPTEGRAADEPTIFAFEPDTASVLAVETGPEAFVDLELPLVETDLTIGLAESPAAFDSIPVSTPSGSDHDDVAAELEAELARIEARQVAVTCAPPVVTTPTGHVTGSTVDTCVEPAPECLRPSAESGPSAAPVSARGSARRPRRRPGKSLARETVPPRRRRQALLCRKRRRSSSRPGRSIRRLSSPRVMSSRTRCEMSEPSPLRAGAALPWRASAAAARWIRRRSSVTLSTGNRASGGFWNLETEASKVAQVLPFVPRVDPGAESHVRQGGAPGDVETIAIGAAGESITRSASEWRPATDETVDASTTTPAAKRGWRINWKRTAAAALALMLLEGVAFATAYWFVKPAEMGTLLVCTSQGGIEVLIDGRKSGVTPLTVNPKPGRHTLEMRDTAPPRSCPSISPGVVTTQSVKWARGAPLGKLSVKTTPAGARILVDGAYKGTAPLSLDDVRSARTWWWRNRQPGR